jgi:anti-sigma factor RsiW
MTCREAIDVLADYLDQMLSPEMASRLDRHLRDCRPCVAYFKTYRKTRELVGQVGRVEMPDEMKARLREFLVEQLGKPQT